MFVARRWNDYDSVMYSSVCNLFKCQNSVLVCSCPFPTSPSVQKAHFFKTSINKSLHALPEKYIPNVNISKIHFTGAVKFFYKSLPQLRNLICSLNL